MGDYLLIMNRNLVQRSSRLHYKDGITTLNNRNVDLKQLHRSVVIELVIATIMLFGFMLSAYNYAGISHGWLLVCLCGTLACMVWLDDTSVMHRQVQQLRNYISIQERAFKEPD